MCYDVEVEPHLQPLNNETFHYKTANVQDISMNSFGVAMKNATLIAMRVFNPLATSNNGPNLQSTYRKHESLKKRVYKLQLKGSGTQFFYPIDVFCYQRNGP